MDDIREMRIQKRRLKKRRRQHKIIFCGIILFIILSLIGIFIFKILYSAPEEKYAIESVQKLKNTLRDPDSLVLHDDVLVIVSQYDDDDPTYYIYISYGARNGYGGMSRNTAMFKHENLFDKDLSYLNNTYLGNYDDDKESEDDAIARAILFLFRWDKFESEKMSANYTYKHINKESIMKKIN